MRITPVRVTRGAFAFVFLSITSLVAASCSSAEETPAPPPPNPDEALDAGPTNPPEWDRAVNPPADEDAESSRKSCSYKVGALPAETQGKSRPSGAKIPVDTIVIAMMENRSFDHYFQKGKEAGLDVEVAPDDFTNPDSEGKPVAPFHLTRHYFIDTAHDWSSIKTQVGGGKMDGFIRTNDGNHELPAKGTPDMLSGTRAMGYHTEADIPFAYWMARNFSIGDRYFASVPTATWPNRMFLYGASSFGNKSNDFPKDVKSTIIDHLNARQISWRVYMSGTPAYAIFLDKFLKARLEDGRFVPIEQFYSDAAAGKLPQVAFVDSGKPTEEPQLNSDEHPPAPATIGQNWLNLVVTALAKSPQWSRSAMFVTYDEHGGLYDHVPPPKACAPDDRATDPTDTTDVFGSYGLRVPFFVVSPFAKKGFVTHRTYDHTSILRFVEARFTLPALSNRDANAEAPWDVFDFERPPTPTAPEVPPYAIDTKIVGDCNAVWK